MKQKKQREKNTGKGKLEGKTHLLLILVHDRNHGCLLNVEPVPNCQNLTTAPT
jgi:hypothetical protein